MKHIKPVILTYIAFITSISCFDTQATQSPGCDTDGISSGVYNLNQGDLSRTYRVHVPKDNDNSIAKPLVMLFHGWSGDENGFLDNAVVTKLADENGYILVAPRGLGSGSPDNSANSWSFSGSTTGLDGDGINPDVPGDSEAICDVKMTPPYSYPSCQSLGANICAWTQCQVDDVAFVSALLNEVESELCVDSKNIFATGGSNGGMFTWELAQNSATAPYFRAIAPIIGLPHRGYLSTQAKHGDLPVLVLTGTKDDTVPPGEWEDANFTTTFNGADRFYYASATAITRSWASAHGCDVSSAAASFDEGTDQADCRTYCSEDSGWPRVLDCRAEMGHSYELSWSWELVMDFFNAHLDS